MLLTMTCEKSVRPWYGKPEFHLRSSHTKDSKNGTDAVLLCTQHYKVRIKVKVEQIPFEMFVKVLGSLNKFPDFFRMATFIDSTHMEL